MNSDSESHAHRGPKYIIDKLIEQNKNLRVQTTKDPLTSLYNRRFLNEQLPDICQQFDSITVFMFDADDFKKINEQFGHEGGDRVLQRIAHVIQDNLKSTDFPVRYGGDEDLVILPNVSDKNTISQIALRLQLAFQANNLHVSFGFATAIKDDSHPTIDLSDTIKQADKHLLAMKSYKNQI